MDGRVEVDGSSRSRDRSSRYRLVTAVLILAIATSAVIVIQQPLVVRERALAESVSVSEEFIQAFNARDFELVASLVTDGAEVSINPARSPQELETTMAWMQATGWNLTARRCTASDRGAEEGTQRVLCLVTQENAWSRILGLAPDRRSAFTFEVAEGRIVGAFLSFAPMSFPNESVISFEAWLNERHPEDEQFMYTYDRLPSLSAESIELWSRYTDEFVAEEAR